MSKARQQSQLIMGENDGIIPYASLLLELMLEQRRLCLSDAPDHPPCQQAGMHLCDGVPPDRPRAPAAASGPRAHASRPVLTMGRGAAEGHGAAEARLMNSAAANVWTPSASPSHCTLQRPVPWGSSCGCAMTVPLCHSPSYNTSTLLYTSSP